jgi:ElaB/YqjD/DUF883 family membrane-anchored ribosome-binding protein
METKNNKHETPKQQKVDEPGSADASKLSILEQGAEAFGQVEQAVSDAYDKTTRVVKKTHKKAKKFSSHNPGKSILIAAGVGVGLGIILSARSHHSRSGRYARPVVNALSEIALEFFR